jgi:adenylate cyclase class 2
LIEIEGPSEGAVRWPWPLGFGYDQARFGSIVLLYKSETGRDILAEVTPLFEEGQANA